MPPDPFEGDPNDPASFISDEDDAAEMLPLTPEEEQQVREDYDLLCTFKAHLEPEGYLGICMTCPDCDAMHYYDWEIMRTNMLASLRGELAPVHEPSPNPDPMRYVTWDFCHGWLACAETAERKQHMGALKAVKDMFFTDQELYDEETYEYIGPSPEESEAEMFENMSAEEYSYWFLETGVDDGPVTDSDGPTDGEEPERGA